MAKAKQVDERKRALVYVRKSVVRTGSDTVSPERQKAACLAEAERHEWVVDEGDVYSDAEGHRSGRDENRPAWLTMRRRIAADPSVAALIVESLSRPSRTVKSFLEFVEELDERRIALVSLKERFDTTTAMGRAMLMFVAVINQLESDLASERMRANIGFKKAGGRHWGRTPFGCRREKEKGALLPGAQTYGDNGGGRRYYDSLVRCYELYGPANVGFAEVANQLNAEGWRFRGRKGEAVAWDKNSVRSVVAMNRVYEGWVSVSGAAKDKPEEWVPANYEPVVEPGLCRVVAAAWQKRSEEVQHPVPATMADSEYTLTGIAFCARCGAKLKGERGKTGRTYRHAGPAGECRGPRALAAEVEEQAVRLLSALVFPPEVAEAVAAIMYQDGGAGDLEEELGGVRQAVARKQVEVDRLIRIAVSSGLDEGDYTRNLAKLNQELAALRQEEASLEAELDRSRRGPVDVVAEMGRLADLVAGAPARTQRELLASLFERVEIDGRRVTGARPREWCRPFLLALAEASVLGDGSTPVEGTIDQ